MKHSDTELEGAQWNQEKLASKIESNADTFHSFPKLPFGFPFYLLIRPNFSEIIETLM